MLADNLGYGDVGCLGSGGAQRGMPTPNIDAPGQRAGCVMNQFLVEAGVHAIAGGLLTGRYSIRSGCR